MRILITFALDLEFAPWRRRHSFTRIPDPKLLAYEGSFADAQVRVLLTGVGGLRARGVISAAWEWRPDICMTAGLAGGLRSDYHCGEILAAREIMELESGRTVVGDATLLGRAEACEAVLIDRLLTSATMILSAEGKKRLGNMAGAVEMESFRVVSEAAARGIRAIAIRAISDEVQEDLPLDFGGVLGPSGQVNTANLARALVRAPHKLPALVRLGRHSRAAAVALAEFMERYVLELAESYHGSALMAEARRA